MKAYCILMGLVASAVAMCGCQRSPPEPIRVFGSATNDNFSYVIVHQPDEQTISTGLFFVGRFTDMSFDERRYKFSLANGKEGKIEYESGRQYWIHADLRVETLGSPITYEEFLELRNSDVLIDESFAPNDVSHLRSYLEKHDDG